MTNTRAAAAHAPVARVYPLVQIGNLDRPFDYLVPEALSEACQPGTRVRVRFSGRLVDAWVVERREDTDFAGDLAWVQRMAGDEVVVTEEIAQLIKRLVARYAGTTSDVARMVIPPRHAGAAASDFSTPFEELGNIDEPDLSGWMNYHLGQEFVDAVLAGKTARAAWQMAVGDDGFGMLAALLVKTAVDGGGVICVLPDVRQVERLEKAVRRWVSAKQVTVLHAALGPSARYRRFMSIVEGQARIVIGTRSAAFAPVKNPRLLVVVDDGNEQMVDNRSPYVHVREVATTRSVLNGAALLIASLGRTAETQLLVESGWLADIRPDEALKKRLAPMVRAVADSDFELKKDPLAAVARIPSLAYQVVKETLAANRPVLVQVPRTGYVPALSCQTCRTPARCRACHGPLGFPSSARVPQCSWCGRLESPFRCQECGGDKLRNTVVGVRRTAEELGKAFPKFPITISAEDRIVDEVAGDKARIVIATPGAEPSASGDGYGAALLLDGWALMGRQDLRAWEKSVRLWLRAVSLVMPASAGGQVVVAAEASAMPVQALIRLDPVGFAARELQQRREAELPPAVHMAAIDTTTEAALDIAEVLETEPALTVLGPVEVPLSSPTPTQWGLKAHEVSRVLVKIPAEPKMRELLSDRLRAVRERFGLGSKAVRLRIHVDPVDIG